MKMVSVLANKAEVDGLDGSYNGNDNYYCDECRFSTNSLNLMNAHLELSLHKKKMVEKNRMKSRMKEKVIGCRGCGFGAAINKRFHAHVKTMKHEKLEVTRSNKPSRSTRTFTKKTSSSALTKSVASPSEEDMESFPPPTEKN